MRKKKKRIGPPLDKSNAKFLIICTKCQNEWTKLDLVSAPYGLTLIRVRCEHCGQTLELTRKIRRKKG